MKVTSSELLDMLFETMTGEERFLDLCRDELGKKIVSVGDEGYDIEE